MKNIISKAGILMVALVLGISPMTVSASSKVLTEPLTVTESADEAKEEVANVSYGALTPEGNLKLVDDYGSDRGAGKQFITVETKNGEYFYIIIDRDANGMEKVHFLNKVDEKDLLNVMAEEEVEEYLSQTENAEIVPEDEDVLNEPELEQTEPVETEPEIVGLPPVTSLLLISGVLGIGSLVGYLYLKKKKTVRSADASADNEEEENIPEDLDETEFDDEDLDVDEEE